MRQYALTTVLTKMQDFWNVTPHQLVNSYQHFGGDCCLHLQGQSSTREDQEYGVSSYITVA
jgi:hypothetical protein